MEIIAPLQEDALRFIVKYLGEPTSSHVQTFSSYGYEFYLPNIMRSYLQERHGLNHLDAQRHVTEISPSFYNAAWELCRRGIARPGLKRYGEQATSDGSSGNGYSITPFGRQWLQESDKDLFVPTEPERFGKLLEPYREKFGAGFHQRAQEAIRCYGAHAFLACCAMCGAAAEAIYLAAAVAKVGDENLVVREYYSTGGRKKIENRLLGQAPAHIIRGFSSLSEMMKYWRDDAAHGGYTSIDDHEAFTAIAMLLRFCTFVDKSWSEITGKRIKT